MKKTLTIVVLLLVALGAFVVFGLNDEKQNLVDSTNWKIYTNTKYGYTLKYPEDYKIEGSTEFGDPALITHDASIVCIGKAGADYIFGIRLTNDTELTESGMRSNFSSTRPEDILISETQVAGLKAYKLTLSKNVKGVVSDFYFVKKEGQNTLLLTVRKTDDVAHTILETLKFN